MLKTKEIWKPSGKAAKRSPADKKRRRDGEKVRADILAILTNIAAQMAVEKALREIRK